MGLKDTYPSLGLAGPERTCCLRAGVFRVISVALIFSTAFFIRFALSSFKCLKVNGFAWPMQL